MNKLIFLFLLLVVPATAFSRTWLQAADNPWATTPMDTSDAWKMMAWEVGKGVAIVEGLNLLYANEKKIWATMKTAERYAAVATMVRVMKGFYDWYFVWKKLMDRSANLVDNIQQVEECVEQAQTTASSICDYYRDFDWKGLSLTNLTTVLPMYRFNMLEYYINGAKSSAEDAFRDMSFILYLSELRVLNPRELNMVGVAQRMLVTTIKDMNSHNNYLTGSPEGLAGAQRSVDRAIKTTTNSNLNTGFLTKIGCEMAAISSDLSKTNTVIVHDAMMNTYAALGFIQNEAVTWQEEAEFLRSASQARSLYDLPSASPWNFNNPVYLVTGGQ